MGLNIVILVLYVGILFLIGYFSSKRIKNISDFYVGGKKMGYWAVAFSARASGESAWLLIGLTGMGAMVGISAYWILIGELLGVGVSWFFMAKRFKRQSDKFKSITIPDYLESRFKTTSHSLRKLSAFVLSIFVMIYVSSQIDATGIAFESMIGINYYVGALIGLVIVITYITMGGFIATIWSDFFQGLVMLLGLVFLPLVAWYSIRNTIPIYEKLTSIDPGLTSFMGGDSDPWINVMTILGFAFVGLGYLGAPQIYVRFMSIKSEGNIDKGKWVAILFTLITDFAAVSIGILARVYFTNHGDDAVSILGIGGKDVLQMVSHHFLPIGLSALYVAVVLSAIMSTIDSLLVLASSAVTRDFYQKIFRPNSSEVHLTKVSRIFTFIIAIVAFCLAMCNSVLSPNREVYWVVIFGWSGIAVSFCPMIILSLFWKKYSVQGAKASMISGFSSVLLFKFVVEHLDGVGIYFQKMGVMLPSFIVSILMGILFSKIFPPKFPEPDLKALD